MQTISRGSGNSKLLQGKSLVVVQEMIVNKLQEVLTEEIVQAARENTHLGLVSVHLVTI